MPSSGSFSPGLDDRKPKFYARPQQALPPKVYDQIAPIIYDPSGGRS
jgi:hypothetical protein